MGPSVPSWLTHTSATGHMGTRPWLGRMPNTLFQAAGLRKLPIKSLPSATLSMRVASATAAPPELPPADLVGSNALHVAPNTSLNVCEPSPNSGTLVLPMTMQPAAFMRCTIKPSSLGTKFFNNGLPLVEAIPAVGAMSLIAIGTPCSQPFDSPRASKASLISACLSKFSVSTRLTMAL